MGDMESSLGNEMKQVGREEKKWQMNDETDPCKVGTHSLKLFLKGKKS